MFLLSEKTEWQKEKETFTEMKNKLEEQKEVDGVKIQQFNVSQTDKCLYGINRFTMCLSFTYTHPNALRWFNVQNLQCCCVSVQLLPLT